MATNPFFQNGSFIGSESEQRMFESMIVECIQIYGADVYYLPRTSVKQDRIFGEDVLSQFTQAYPIEMYLENVEGWDGNGELFSKFGISVVDRATFVVAKRRWEEEVALKTDNLQLLARPAEGDLIYFPLTNALFEIMYVDHLKPFYQLSKFFTYSLQCELYQYSSEFIQTGLERIDSQVDVFSQDMNRHVIHLQSGEVLLLQNGEHLLQEKFSTETNAPLSNSEDIRTESQDIVDFSVDNPFGSL